MPPKKIDVPKNIEGFFAARTKRPDLFTFDADGNAIYKDALGKVVKTFPLDKYRSATKEELDELYIDQMEILHDLFTEFEAAKTVLRTKITAGEAPKNIIEANQRVQEIQQAITSVRSPARGFQIYKNPTIRDILLEDQYETRKFKTNVLALKNFSILSYDSLLKSVSRDAEALDEVALEYVSIFDDPTKLSTNDLPILGLYKRKDISIKDDSNTTTLYHSLLEAVIAETMKANDFEPEKIRELTNAGTPGKKVRIASTGKEISTGPGAVRQVAEPYSLTKASFTKDDTKVFKKVIQSAIEQWTSEPDNFKRALKETGDKTIVYVAPKQRTQEDRLLALFGTGLLPGKASINDDGTIEATAENQENPARWKGLNLWGEALQAARDTLETTGGGLDEETLKKTKKAQVGAIIHHYKNH